ncbi:hypothetical protein BGX26_012893 [Mortierella sp. AD094]|nr:hypothetical protein BGX26_012893 [Mortierella sp. AD094]
MTLAPTLEPDTSTTGNHATQSITVNSTTDGDIISKGDESDPALNKQECPPAEGVSKKLGEGVKCQQLLLHHNKERMIANVLQQGKLLKVSRRLRTRLEYAILKIRRGWSKYTLQEVESLLQPGRLSLSPPPQSRGSAKSTLLASASPRQSERKRIRKVYPDYETGTEVRTRTQTPEVVATPNANSDAEIAAEESRFKRYRSSRPSFSQFKDSELFLPAKSLMDIATSASSSSPSPSPPPRQQRSYTHRTYPQQPPQQQQQSTTQSNSEFGSVEPLYRESTPSTSDWSTYSVPSSPATESSAMLAMQSTFGSEEAHRGHDNEAEGPPDTQAARTILLLASSPTRPPPRTLINTSSAQVAQQKQGVESAPGTAVSAIIAAASSSMTPYSPTTSSPLVQFQVMTSTPSPSPTPTPGGSPVIDDNNPFLIKKGAAKLTSKALKSHQGVRQNEPTSMSHPPQSAASSHASTPSDIASGNDHEEDSGTKSQETTPRAMTPVIDETTAPILAPPRTPPQQHRQNPSQEHQTAPIGIRTPPPSGSREPIQSHYVPHSHSPKSIVAESIAARRRNSGLTGGSGVDLVAMYLKSEKPAADSSSSPSSPPTVASAPSNTEKQK